MDASSLAEQIEGVHVSKGPPVWISAGSVDALEQSLVLTYNLWKR